MGNKCEQRYNKKNYKKIIKKSGMRWKRMKRGMIKTPDEWELEAKIPRL